MIFLKEHPPWPQTILLIGDGPASISCYLTKPWVRLSEALDNHTHLWGAFLVHGIFTHVARISGHYKLLGKYRHPR